MFSHADFITMLQERASREDMWRLERCERGTELLRQGGAGDQLVVMMSGLAKLTYLTPSGDEWIKSFIVDQGLFGALDGKISRFGAISLESCTVVRLRVAWVLQEVAADPRLGAQTTALYQSVLDRKQKREEALLCDTAEVRYRKMLDEEPDLLARLPQGDVARYLRVTPIAFSRIKRRVRSTSW